MGYCLTRDHQMALGLFPLVQPLHPRTETDGKLGRFPRGPLEIRMAIFDVALTFPLAVTDFRAPHTPTVRGVVADSREAAHIAGFQHDRLRQNRPDTVAGLQLRVGGGVLQPLLHRLFQGFDLLPQAVQNGQTAGDGQDLLGVREQALEFCREDECVEVTPEVVRIRKVILDQTERARTLSRQKKQDA